MTSYAIAHLISVEVGPPIIEYLQQIDATLAPFGGHFIIHGGAAHVLEGEWSGDLIVIAFPDRAAAAAWYASSAYQAILPLRVGNAAGTVFLIDGVDDDHRATDVLTQGSA